MKCTRCVSNYIYDKFKTVKRPANYTNTFTPCKKKFGVVIFYFILFFSDIFERNLFWSPKMHLFKGGYVIFFFDHFFKIT